MRTAALALALLAGCSGLKMEGACTYSRTVETQYVCKPDGKIDHYKIDAPEG
jgi:hypothetical protein